MNAENIGLFLVESIGEGIKRRYAETPILLAEGETVTIGRHGSLKADIPCQFVNGVHKAVSSLHVTVERISSGWVVYDGDGNTPSSNGIFSGNSRIDHKILISENNDSVYLIPKSNIDFSVYLLVRDVVFVQSLEKTSSLEESVKHAAIEVVKTKAITEDNNNKLLAITQNVEAILRVVESTGERSDLLIKGSNTLVKLSIRGVLIAAAIGVSIWLYRGGLVDIAKLYVDLQNNKNEQTK
jgi:pSer/pThr/pTyr-binding forkhead associated (FHA) protein